jgi:hypothetical protein
MNTELNTPTPRTDAYEFKAGWAAANYGEPWKPMDFARSLERELADAEAELAAERERIDWVFRNCKVTADDFTTGNRDVYAIHDREDLGAAMKEDGK